MTVDGPIPGVGTWRTVMWTGMAAILAAPLVAMPFARGVRWDAADFAAAAMLLLAVGLAVEVATRRIGDRRRQIAVAGGAILAGMTVWADAAIGVF